MSISKYFTLFGDEYRDPVLRRLVSWMYQDYTCKYYIDRMISGEPVYKPILQDKVSVRQRVFAALFRSPEVYNSFGKVGVVYQDSLGLWLSRPKKNVDKKCINADTKRLSSALELIWKCSDYWTSSDWDEFCRIVFNKSTNELLCRLSISA